MRRASAARTPGPVFGRRDPDARGYYGPYGGRFVPETLVAPVEELERAYLEARADENFRRELAAGGGLSSYPHPWLKDLPPLEAQSFEASPDRPYNREACIMSKLRSIGRSLYLGRR